MFCKMCEKNDDTCVYEIGRYLADLCIDCHNNMQEILLKSKEQAEVMKAEALMHRYAEGHESADNIPTKLIICERAFFGLIKNIVEA